MNVGETVAAIFLALSGLGLFLYGMTVLGDSLETAAGQKLKRLFNKITNNRFVGVTIGTGTTVLVQSSSVTTVIIVGFVNAGIMTLSQAVPIIMGANIGTTITAHMVALSSFKVMPFLCSAILLGIILKCFKKSYLKNIGTVLIGIGVIFIALEFMGAPLKKFAQIESVKNAFAEFKNPFLLFLIGIIFTAIVQSSSATTAILITLSSQGLLTLDQAIFATIGSNIGTCVTALLASIGANENAKRVSFIHLLFNLTGSLIFLPIMAHTNCSKIFMRFEHIETQIAMFHTFFNVSTTVVLIWFVKPICKFSKLVIKDKENNRELTTQEKVENKIDNIKLRMLDSPSIALEQTKNELKYMHSLSRKNLEISLEAVTTSSPDFLNTFQERENEINITGRELTKLFISFLNNDMSKEDQIILGTYFHVVSDLERMGDYAKKIFRYALDLQYSNKFFSEEVTNDVLKMYNLILEIDNLVMEAFNKKSLKNITAIEQKENEIDLCRIELENKYIIKPKERIFEPRTAIIFSGTINSLERIADHLINVAYSLKDYIKIPIAAKTV